MTFRIYWINLHCYHETNFDFLFDAIEFGKAKKITFRVDHGPRQVLMWSPLFGMTYLDI